MTGPDTFLEQWHNLIMKGDLGELMELYSPDSMIVHFDKVISGTAEITQHYISFREDLKGVEVQMQQMAEDLLFYQADLVFDGNELSMLSTVVFRDGLVWRQTEKFSAKRAPE